MSVKLAAADRQHYNGKPNDRNYQFRAIHTLPATGRRAQNRRLNTDHMCVHIALVSRRRSLNSTTPSASNIPPKCHTLNIGKLLIFATLPATGHRAQNRRLNTDHMCVHIALVSRRRSLNSTTPSPSNIPPKCHTLNIGKLLIFATLPATGHRAQNRRLNTDHMCVHIAVVSRRRSLNSTTPSPSNIPPKCHTLNIYRQTPNFRHAPRNRSSSAKPQTQRRSHVRPYRSRFPSTFPQFYHPFPLKYPPKVSHA
jgi:hypothetical protein